MRSTSLRPSVAPDRRRGDAQPHGGRRERGSSVIELTLYMPILMLVVFVAVQFSLTYLGNQVVSSVARETARAVRQGADTGQANAVAVDYAQKIGSGVISNLSVTVTHPDADTVDRKSVV